MIFSSEEENGVSLPLLIVPLIIPASHFATLVAIFVLLLLVLQYRSFSWIGTGRTPPRILSFSFSPSPSRDEGFGVIVCISNMIRSNVIPTINCCNVNTNGGTVYRVRRTLDEAIDTTPNKYQRRTAAGTGMPVDDLDDDVTTLLALSCVVCAVNDAVVVDDAVYDGSSMPPTTPP